jgi:mannose/fructose/N-acetylgalactosamine-specific phosphotransferase system component IIC
MSLLEFYLVSVALSLMYVAIFYGAGKLSKDTASGGVIASFLPGVNSFIGLLFIIVAVSVALNVIATTIKVLVRRH